MKHFEKVSDVPEFPLFDSEKEKLNAINEYLEAGAIAKKDLISGAWYIGQSRSTEIAQWISTTERFNFIRYKMGGEYIDHIPHFSDEDLNDVFIPIKRIEL